MMLRTSAKEYFESQYVLRKTLPSFAEDIAKWEDLSSDEYFVDLNTSIFQFGRHSRQTFELLKANKAPSEKGLAIFIHGGFWRSINRQQSRFMARPFVNAGYDCIISEYRLMPEFRLEQLVDDTAQMLLCVKDMQDRGLFSKKLLISGHSAGAHLAAFGLGQASEQGFNSHDCALLYLSGVFDVYPVSITSIGEELALTQDEIRRWSVYEANLDRHVNSLFVVGADETDEFKRQSIIGAQFLNSSDQNNILEVPNVNHLTLLTRIAQEPEILDEILSILN